MSKKNKSQNIDPYDFIIETLSGGVVMKKDPRGYTGSPGREVYAFLESDPPADKLSTVASVVAAAIPSKPLSRAVHLSLFLRYLYGCMEKQGTVRNSEQRKQWTTERKSWERSDQFMSQVCGLLKKAGNRYGLCLCHEMMAHRRADTAAMTGNMSYLDEAISLYDKAASEAEDVGAVKNTYSTRFWAFRYLHMLTPKSPLCMKYAMMFFEAMDKNCKTSTAECKMVPVLNALMSITSRDEWDRLVYPRLSQMKNKILRKFSYRKISGKYPIPFR